MATAKERDYIILKYLIATLGNYAQGHAISSDYVEHILNDLDEVKKAIILSNHKDISKD